MSEQAMSDQDAFEITVGGGAVRGVLRRPDSSRGRRVPVVLLCAALPIEPDRSAFDALYDQIVETLVDGEIAAATYEPRSPSGNGEARTDPTGLVDDASAVFRMLLQHDEIDRDRVGVLGYSSSALVAAGLAARAPRFLASLCLIAPATAELGLPEAASSEDEDAEAASQPHLLVEALAALDPVADAGAHDRPTLIVHGAADRVVAPEVGLAYHRRLESTGRQSRAVLVPRGDHAFSEIESRVACVEQLRAFFRAMASPAAAGES